jgi:hypothetical protein
VKPGKIVIASWPMNEVSVEAEGLGDTIEQYAWGTFVPPEKYIITTRTLYEDDNLSPDFPKWYASKHR